ncbi:MAG: glycosyltransferase [Tildeniella nuda ZEHNDER 1965/U140]|jgi:glycosyltransferase involved in cell wall biosynthesis|nr:glycosyltransferase [Tildeniella nuda ZEHNDER 1965/U140]
MVPTSLPFVSVIIPVFNDGERLQRCLRALDRQTYPAHLYEVIVVDNGSDALEPIADIAAQFQQTTHTYESQPGSYAARNQGLTLAKGAVIAFTDADCLPAINWIEQGVACLLQTPKVGLVGGKIECSFVDATNPTPVELYESLWYPLPQQEFVEKHHFAATANLFTFASVMQQVGGFDGTLKSNGDREWGQRVHQAGYTLIYGETVQVTHPARHHWSELQRRARRIIGGRYDLHQKAPFWQRQQFFILTIAQYLLAPIVMLGFNFLLDRRLKTLQQKVHVSRVMFFVSYWYVWELVRLKCGAPSYRG